MNDNMKKLIEQAGFYVDDQGKVWGDPANPITDQTVMLIKLIVEKCGDIANDYVDRGTPSNPIDQYFGVY
jgi:hypothetical protein